MNKNAFVLLALVYSISKNGTGELYECYKDICSWAISLWKNNIHKTIGSNCKKYGKKIR